MGHVEAGLRTLNKHLPFPKEINRRLISSQTEPILFDSVDDMVKKLMAYMAYIEEYNRNAKPFRWTYTGNPLSLPLQYFHFQPNKLRTGCADRKTVKMGCAIKNERRVP